MATKQITTDYVPNFTMYDPAVAAASETVPINSLKDLFGRGWDWTKNHKLATAGTGLNALGNVAGLTDNDKLLGQAAGTAIGAFAPKLIQKFTGIPINLGGLGKANLAMLGGNLGALFDTLRSKSEQEKAAQMPSSYTTY